MNLNNPNQIDKKSFEKVGRTIHKYNIRLSNHRLKIKYYKLILETINLELKDLEEDYNIFNNCLSYTKFNYDFNNISTLEYKKKYINKQKITLIIDELEKDDKILINEIFL